MKHPRTQLAFAAASWLVLGSGLASSGQNVAQPPWRGQDARATTGQRPEPVIVNSKPLPPGVTVEHRGRLLVLTYGSKSAEGGLMPNVNPQDEAPGFVVWQGQRPIASGRFEFG